MIYCLLTFRPFDPSVLVLLGAVVLLLAISALVSGAETAFFSLSPSNINQVRNHPGKANNAILKLLGMEDYLLATILVANNLVNIAIVILSNDIINHVIDFDKASATAEFLVKTVIVTFVLLLFGEIIPKIFAGYSSLKFARFIAPFILFLKTLLKPISYVLIRFGNLINGSVSSVKPNISIGELSNAIEITGSQSEEERKMLSGIVGFVRTEVTEIMKPRLDVVAIDADSDFAQVKNRIIESGFSRIPVYEESLDKIKGVLYVKDLIAYLTQERFDWLSLIRKPYFVPENKKINDLLEEFQANKVHLAIVVDEYGSTLGLVSLEDILEEIVGEITDESDHEQAPYDKVGENTYIFEGKSHLSELEKVYDLGEGYFDNYKGDSETIAGMLIEQKRDFLRRGEELTVAGYLFTVQSMEGRRAGKIKVKPAPAAHEPKK